MRLPEIRTPFGLSMVIKDAAGTVVARLLCAPPAGLSGSGQGRAHPRSGLRFMGCPGMEKLSFARWIDTLAGMFRYLFPALLVMGFFAFPPALARAETPGMGAGIAAYEAGAFDKAKTILLPLAEAGNPHAQYLVGDMYYEGQSVVQNYGAAIDWYTKAGKQGHAQALGALGYMANNGVGTSQDDKKALCLFIDAARRGYANAQWNLARHYWKRRHWERYEYWLVRAERQGNPYALGRQAEVWLLNPLEFDKTKAYLYLMVAARKGHENSIQRLKEIREAPSLFAVEQLQRAEQLLPTWR
tara:strand:- start:1962 stop:2861 length:900 start_codon:yes stop_codon:yes gene_type:complete